jgi:hypothetical protein
VPPSILHSRQNPTHDVDLVLVELSALHKPTNAPHEIRSALRAVAKIDLLQHLRQVNVHTLHILRRCHRGSPWRRIDLHATRAENLVGDKLHRHGEI